ncbi:MAG: hypothetical protein ACLFP0_07860 [Rhodosalinus sp.]
MRLGLLCSLLVVAAGLGLLARWALAELPVAPAPPALPDPAPDAPPPSASLSIDPAAWQIALWQPLRDPPEVEPPPPEPPQPTAALFSVVVQGDTRTAVLDLGAAEGLVYLESGQEHGDYEVRTIHAEAVEIVFRGHPFRLELAR